MLWEPATLPAACGSREPCTGCRGRCDVREAGVAELIDEYSAEVPALGVRRVDGKRHSARAVRAVAETGGLSAA